MNRLSIILICLTLSIQVHGQTNLDSLENHLSSVSGKDSVIILNNLGLNYAYSDISKAKIYSEEALRVAQRIGFGEGEVAALINVGYSHFDHNRIDSSIFYFEKAVTLATEIGNDNGIGSANNALGNTFRETGRYEESVKYYKEALIIQERIGDKRGISSSLNNLGRALNSLAAYNEATEYLLKALEINLENGWTRKAALNLLGLTQTKVDKQEEQLALDYVRQLLAMEEIKDDLYIQTDVYNQLGFIHGKLENFDESEAAFQKGLELFEQYGKLPGVLLHNYADMKLSKGDPIEAEKLALQALKYKQQKKSRISQSYTFNLLSDIYLEMGETIKALDFSNKALKITIEEKAKSRERKTYMDIAEIYQQEKNYEQALRFRLKYEHLQDSLFTSQKAAQQRAMLTLFETEKKQQQIESQQARIEAQQARQEQQETQKYLLIGGIIAVAFIAMVVLWSYLNSRRSKQRIESQNEQLLQLNKTKDKFFGIIAHDLRSPLLGLQGVGDQVDYFLKKGKTDRLEKVSKSISSTSKRLNELLDNLLSWALLQNGMIPYHPQQVNIKYSIDSVIQLLNPIAEMKEVKLSNNINSDTLVFADEKAIETILRNLISNALKFSNPGGEVTVNIKEKEGQVTIMINDTGTGISAEMIPRLFDLEKESKTGTLGEKGTGLGLVLCKELVELNKGSIEVESVPGKGSTFIFDLPKAA